MQGVFDLFDEVSEMCNTDTKTNAAVWIWSQGEKQVLASS